MRKFHLSLVVIVSCLLAYSGAASGTDLGIITGGEKGTYYQFGLNLKELGQNHGYNLSVYNSTGSIENIYAVYKRPRTQMGIVQSDVLAFVSKVRTNPTLMRIAKKTKMVFPLYNEEIHLLGRRGLVDFDDLAGKRVAIGKEGSGTYLTARLLFEVAEVQPAEMVPIGTDQALEQLKAGQIDAMFYVAGLPVKLFNESVTADDGLVLLPILNKSVIEFYPQATIPANTYPWQTEDVQSVAVKAVLVSFDFRRANCQFVGGFAKVLADNMDWLRENGHPKWNAVDLDYALKGWDQYDCVRKVLATKKVVKKKEPTELNPVLNAVKEMLKTP